jgi:RNA polymerase sigma-70 factor (ECF subfamily)
MDLKKSKKDSDVNLVAGLKNKEEKAFIILVERYKSHLFFYIRKIVGNDLDAEDLVMIIFTKVFTAIDSYTPRFLFSTWLFKMARNASIDFIKLRNHRIYGDEKLNYYIISDMPDPEQIMISKENVKIIKYKIKHSNPLFREIIILRSMFSTYQEIEQVYGMKINSGLQHTRRSRIFFRETLNNL